jgi:hypothetical protein
MRIKVERRRRRWSPSRITNADPHLARRNGDLDHDLIVVAAAVADRVRDQFARNKQRVLAPFAADAGGIKNLREQTSRCRDSSRLGRKRA